MYVSGNPMKCGDPTGHGEECEWVCFETEDGTHCELICLDLDELGDPFSNGETADTVPVFTFQTSESSNPLLAPWVFPVLPADSESPAPESPPDFDSPQPDGAPCPPPDIPGLDPEKWEWKNDWPDGGRGYKHPDLPPGIPYRPDKGYKNRPGTDGEDPHWHYPGGYFPKDKNWGRPGQRKGPRTLDPSTVAYVGAGVLIVGGVAVIAFDIATFPTGEGVLGFAMITEAIRQMTMVQQVAPALP